MDLQDYSAVSNDMLLYQVFAMSLGTMTALGAALARAERRSDQLVRMIEDRQRMARATGSRHPEF